MNYKPHTADRLKAKAAILRNAFVCNATVPRTRSTETPPEAELAPRMQSV